MAMDLSNLIPALSFGLTITLAFLLYRSHREKIRLKRLGTAAQQQKQTLVQLDWLRNELSQTNDLPTLFKATIENIRKSFGYACARLYLIKDDGLKLQCSAGYDTPVEQIPLGESISGRVVRSGQAELVTDVAQDPTFLGCAQEIESSICIPLFDDDQVVGTLHVETPRGTILNDDDLQRMIAVETLLKNLIHNTRLFSEARNNAQSYQTIVQNVKEVIFQTDANDRWLFLNPAWTQLTGAPVDDTIGTTVLQYIQPEDQKPYLAYIAGIISGKNESWHGTLRFVHLDGAARTFEMNMHPERNEDGQFIGTFGTIIDPSMRNEQQGAAISRTVDPVTSNMTYDLNSYLTEIKSNLSLIRQLLPHNIDNRLALRIVEADETANRACGLTNEWLSSNKINPLRPYDTLQDNIKASANFVLQASNVTCEFDLAEDLWPADINHGQISQIIQHLVLNGQQAMPDGGIIQVRGENVMIESDTKLPINKGHYVKIDIIDGGTGIASKDLKKIFKSDFTTKDTGSGFGLTTCHSILSEHRGAISIDSNSQHGTTITAYLPASSDSEVVTSKKDLNLQKKLDNRVLLMDDERIVRSLVSDILTHCGYNVTLTEDGADAVQTYVKEYESGQPFDAVIMDLTVPGGMGGREALQHILTKDPHARVIVSSGYSNDPILANYRQYGFIDMVPKPYHAEELTRVLHNVLSDEEKSAAN